MDLQALLAALALSAGAAHPLGHVSEGGKRGVPMTIDYKNMVESWKTDPKTAGDSMAIHGAGFKAQDDIARAIENPKAKEAAYLANAILKGGYAAGISDKMAKGMENGGDIGGMERASGNKLTRPLVGFAAAMDLIKSQRPEQDWDISAGPVGFASAAPPHGVSGLDADVPLADKRPAMGLTFTKRF